MTPLAFDTSAAVASVLRSHTAHSAVRRHASDRDAELTTYSLADVLHADPAPGGCARRSARRRPAAGGGLLPVAGDPADELGALPRALAARGIAGGAVYDALVGLAARTAAVPLLTHDALAVATYAALDVEIELVPG